MSCDKNKSFQVGNLFNELKTESDKRIARLNLGVKDSDSLTWGNIAGNIYDQEDLVYFVEMLKMLASQTGAVTIFRLNSQDIDRTVQDIPEGWSTELPETTPNDFLYMSRATKQGGIYKVNADGFVWGIPVRLSYSNAIDTAQQEQIDQLTQRLNESIQNQTYLDEVVNSMNQVTVNSDGSIQVVGRDGQVSVWQHQDLGNYLLLGNIYGDVDDDETSYFVINKTGLLQAHNAVVHGTIYATDGWFAGRLDAATGSFRGEVTATSGRIGGWQIIDGTLKPENVPTTALVGSIQASQVDFGNTLTDLRTSIERDYLSKINTLHDQIIDNIELISTRFSVKDNSIESAIQALRTSDISFGQSLETVHNELNNEKTARVNAYEELESKIQQTAERLSLEIAESVLHYSESLDDYIKSSYLDSKLSLLSNQISAKVSQVDYDIHQTEIRNKLAELELQPEYIQSLVTNVIEGEVTTLRQQSNSIQATVTKNDNILSSLGITESGISMQGNVLAYYAAADSTNPVLLCSSNGSGSLANNHISWDAEGNLTVNGTINANSGSIGSWDITDTAISSKDIEISDEMIPNNYVNGNIQPGVAHLYLNFGSEEDGIVPELFCSHTVQSNRVMYYTVVNSYGLGTGTKRTVSNELSNFIGAQGAGWLNNKNINWNSDGELEIKFINILNDGELYNVILNKNGISYINDENPNDSKSITWKQLIDSFD